MKKRILVVITTIFLFMMLTGCWNRTELSRLAIVQAVGIDLTEDNQISLSVQILKPGKIKEKGEQTKGVWVVTSTGETVFDALRNITLEADKKAYAGHNKVVVIGEEAAKAGISPLLDFIRRDHEYRRLSYIFIAKGKAIDIINSEHEQESIPGQALERLAKTTFATSKLPETTINDFLKKLAGKTTDPIAPGIHSLQKNINSETKNVIELDETAIFKKDKLIGWFDHQETRGLLWVLGKVKSGIIVVKSPKDEEKNVSLEITRASSKIKAEIKDGRLSVFVQIKEEGNLGEQMSQVDFSKPETFKELEKRQAAAIEDEINSALDKAQEWGVDLFEFGEIFHDKYPKEWPELKEKWEEKFKKIEVTVDVEARIRRLGISTKSLQAEETEK